jgi:uncharacterized protein YggU (UPF0235/DUF167 family)
MYIKCRVHAGHHTERVVKESETAYEVWLREPAEQNRANRRVLEIMRELYPTARGIKLVSGHHSPGKILSVEVE